MSRRASFWRDSGGSPASEFALVLPLVLLILFGIIEVGGYILAVNRAEKATQTGARWAVATTMIPSGLINYSFVGNNGLTSGDTVTAAAFPGVYCVKTGAAAPSCTCKGTCGFPVTANATAFNNLVARMDRVYPQLTANNVRVDYDYSGIGFAGDPTGPDVDPIVTVRLENATYRPSTLMVFDASVSLPDFSYALTLEDGQGAIAN